MGKQLVGNVKGPRGLQGPPGNQGPQGPQGVKGDTGNQGIKGDQGNTGSQGIKGDTGTTGSSATVTLVPAASWPPPADANPLHLYFRVP